MPVAAEFPRGGAGFDRWGDDAHPSAGANGRPPRGSSLGPFPERTHGKLTAGASHPPVRASGRPRRAAGFRGALALWIATLGTAPVAASVAETVVDGSEGEAGGGARTVVLAIDGVDTAAARAALEAGELPNLAELLGSSDPEAWVPEDIHDAAEAWARIVTGAGVGEHGVQGSSQLAIQAGRPRQSSGPLKHDLERSLAELASAPLPRVSHRAYAIVAGLFVSSAFWVLFAWLLKMRTRTSLLMSAVLGLGASVGGWRLRTYLPERVPVSESRLTVEPYWERAARGGTTTATLFVPGSLPMGLGDSSASRAGDAGESAVDFDLHALVPGRGLPGIDRYPEGVSLSPEGPRRIELRWAEGGDGELEVQRELAGPLNFWRQVRDRKPLEEAQRVKLPWTVEIRNGAIFATIGGAKAELVPRTWSTWMPLTFDLNPVLKIHGITRLWLQTSTAEGVVLWLDDLQLDPFAMPFWNPWVQRGPLGGDRLQFPRIDLMAKVPEDPRLPISAVVESMDSDWEARWSWFEGALGSGEFELVTAVLDTPRRWAAAWTARGLGRASTETLIPVDKPYVEFLGERRSIEDLEFAFLEDLDRRIGELRADPEFEVGRWLLLFLPAETAVPKVFDPNAWLAGTGRLSVSEPGFTEVDPGAVDNLPRPLDSTGTEAFVVGPGLLYLNRERPSSVGERMTRAENLRSALRNLVSEDGSQGPLAAVRMSVREGGAPFQPDLVLQLAPGWTFARSDFRSSVRHAESNPDGIGPRIAQTLEAWPRGAEVLVIRTPEGEGVHAPGRLEDLGDWILGAD